MCQQGVLLILLFLPKVFGLQEFYCDTKYTQTISGISEGVINTREEGIDFYSNNLNCEWELEAQENGRIQLTIESLDLQWNPEYSSCYGYDSLEIREGFKEESALLTSVCHAKNPYSVVSKGRNLYLKFSSNHQNFANRRGIVIRFKLFKNDSCPPDWFQASPSSADCFMIGYNGKADWSRAQDICNLNRANLASILSESEYNTILDYGRNSTSTLTTAWIGLSDREQEGTFKWIDRHNLSYKRDMTGKRYDTHCIGQDFSKTADWSVLDCDSDQNYICKCKKDGSTILYQSDPPVEPPDEDDSGTKVFQIVIVVVVLIVLSCVGAVVFYCFYWRKRNPGSRSKTRKESGQNVTVSANSGGNFSPLHHRDSVPTAPPQGDIMLHDPQMVAPPTYEESQYDPVAVSPSTY